MFESPELFLLNSSLKPMMRHLTNHLTNQLFQLGNYSCLILIVIDLSLFLLLNDSSLTEVSNNTSGHKHSTHPRDEQLVSAENKILRGFHCLSFEVEWPSYGSFRRISTRILLSIIDLLQCFHSKDQYAEYNGKVTSTIEILAKSIVSEVAWK